MPTKTETIVLTVLLHLESYIKHMTISSKSVNQPFKLPYLLITMYLKGHHNDFDPKPRINHLYGSHSLVVSQEIPI